MITVVEYWDYLDEVLLYLEEAEWVYTRLQQNYHVEMGLTAVDGILMYYTKLTPDESN